MQVVGTLEREDDVWVANLDVIGVFAGGSTIDEALAQAVSLIELRATRDGRSLDGFTPVATVVAAPDGTQQIVVRSNQPTRLAFIVLRHQRELRRMTLADVADKLGASSRNAYARYEQGASIPSVDKFVEILEVLLPEFGVTLGERRHPNHLLQAPA
ncbi:MAG TPA: type II toxin-antitoxin system HicB family antitoxin [Kofleriaceae bacterium]|nr:type II toxin-antitoxin system HicB family antitoxin [Kofleriaceae bacterium]